MHFLFNRTTILLILITILAAGVRFYKLGEIPSSLSWDEVAQGYNAYSLGQTGIDEFGRFLPLDYLESFGDFKPVLYTYTAIVPVKIWGLNEFSTRFPSAFFGTLTIFFTFFLVRQIFSEREDKDKIALLTAFIMAVSPWHIQMSRAAFEANLGLFEVVLGIWLLLKGFNNASKYFIWSALPISLVFYTFNSTRAFLPLILPLISLLFIRKWKEKWSYIFAFVVIFQLCLIGVTPHFMSPHASLRFKEVNIFSDLKPIEVSNQRIALDNNTIISRVLHNRRWMFSLEFLRHYLDNLNLRFLFLNGDPNPKFSISDVGQEYLIHLPFFLLGLLFLIKKYPSEAKLIILWLLIGIIPAATARETPHALRILQTLPMWQIIIAVGLWETYLLISKYKLKIIVTTCYFIYYLHNYYAHYPKEYAGEWQYGYKQAIQYAQENYGKYDRITLTDSIGRPYIYALFYTNYPSLSFRQTAVIERDAFGFVKVKSFDKYVFGGQEIIKSVPDKKTLFIVSRGENLNDKKFLKNIYLPNGNPVLKIYED